MCLQKLKVVRENANRYHHQNNLLEENKVKRSMSQTLKEYNGQQEEKSKRSMSQKLREFTDKKVFDEDNP